MYMDNKNVNSCSRILCPKVSVKLEDNSIGSISSSFGNSFTTTSGGSSTNSSGGVLVSRQRILPAVRQTISSPLISTQLKGKELNLFYGSV